MRSHLTEEIDIIQVHQPVRVVHHQRLPVGKVDEAAHLNLEAVNVVLNLFLRHHPAHRVLAGRIADHTRPAAEQRDGTVARHLKPLHQAERHEMPHMKAVGRGVEADVEGRLPVVHKLADLLLVRYLRDQAARLQLFINLHGSSPSQYVRPSAGRKPARPGLSVHRRNGRGSPALLRQIRIPVILCRLPVPRPPPNPSESRRAPDPI